LKEPDRIQLILDAIESVDCEDLDSFEQEVLMEAAKWAWLALENCKTKREKIKTGIAK